MTALLEAALLLECFPYKRGRGGGGHRPGALALPYASNPFISYSRRTATDGVQADGQDMEHTTIRQVGTSRHALGHHDMLPQVFWFTFSNEILSRSELLGRRALYLPKMETILEACLWTKCQAALHPQVRARCTLKPSSVHINRTSNIKSFHVHGSRAG